MYLKKNYLGQLAINLTLSLISFRGNNGKYINKQDKALTDDDRELRIISFNSMKSICLRDDFKYVRSQNTNFLKGEEKSLDGENGSKVNYDRESRVVVVQGQLAEHKFQIIIKLPDCH